MWGIAGAANVTKESFMSMLEFCQLLPKVELHAHLNGSISIDTMPKLIELKSKKRLLGGKDEGFADSNPNSWKTVINDEGEKLESAFEIFKVIHSVVDCEEAIVMAACDVVKEFSADNVQYLELRTTPRANTNSGMTKRSYVDAVVRGIQLALPRCTNDIQVRLLLSIDRRQDITEAYNTIELAMEHRNTGGAGQASVVGIDLSGDPMAGNSRDLLQVLEEGKRRGFKLAVHIAERPNRESDTDILLSSLPDRLGHVTYIHRGPEGHNSQAVQTVLDKKIPIELCQTSNVKARTVSSYSEHQLKFWLDQRHPFIICTDDKGVFNTTLSKEYFIAANTFGLTEKEIGKISKDAMKYTFDSNHIKM